MEHESGGDTICNWCARYRYQRTGTGTGRLGNKRTSGDHLNYCIIKISQITEKGSGDLRRLAVTHTHVKNYQLTLVWKTLEEDNNNYQWTKKKLWNIKVIPIVISGLATISNNLAKGMEELEIGGQAESVQTMVLLRSARIRRNPGDLRRLVVTQTPVKDHQLKLMWKTLKKVIIMIIIIIT